MTVLIFGQLIKVETYPEPTYVWTINGRAVELSPKHILNQRLFRERVFKKLFILHSIVHQETWRQMINHHLSTMEIFGPPDLRPWLLEKWLKQRRPPFHKP